MKKVKLSVDDLSVESFEIPADGEARSGTVRGYARTNRPTCQQSCDSCDTMACPCLVSVPFTACIC